MTLTLRQRQVVRLLAEGLSCVEVARRLGIAEGTIRQHVRDIAAKLDGDLPPVRRIRKSAAQLLAA
jgi:DNA-binding CsgD family transcriptional regulator